MSNQEPSERIVNMGELVRAYRKSLGLTQTEFAKKYNRESATAVSFWESGKRDIPGALALDIIDRKTVEARIDELQRTAVNPYYPGGPSKEDAVVYVKQIRNRIQQLTGGKK